VNKMVRKLFVFAVLLTFFNVGTASAGKLAYGTDELAYSKALFRKLGRSVTNIVMSPLEIFYQPMLMVTGETNGMTALIGGIPKGVLVHFPLRLAVGVADLLTFPVPYPPEFAPWVEPETLVEGFGDL